MSPPPPPALLVGTGLAWNYWRSLRGLPTISRWACEHKPAALTVAVGGSAWLVWHWWTYVIDA